MPLSTKDQLRQLATQEFRSDMSSLIRSRQPLIFLVTTEEKRVIEYFRLYSVSGGYRTCIWDCYNGLLNITNMQPAGLVSGSSSDPIVILDWILKEAADNTDSKGNIYLLLDFHRFMRPCTPEIERRLRTLYRMDSNTVVIMVGPEFESTPALEKSINVIDFPYPNSEEIKASITKVITPVITKIPEIVKDTKQNEEEIIRSVSGLTQSEAEGAFGKSVVTYGRIDISSLLKQKQQIIRKTGILEFFNPEYGLDNVGGLGNLIEWIKKRKPLFNSAARDFGIATPKGILLLGIPGSGKSLSAKAVAKYFQMPLLRLDFGALFQSLVGESENRIRRALRLAEAVAPTVLWCDEIDKGLSGFRSSGTTDSGVTSRVIGTFLTWMQEHKKPVFVVCTANQHESLPTEFLRAGRFDEVFFVDLPTHQERLEIIQVLIARKKRDHKIFDVRYLAGTSDGYTGAEIEKAIDMALIEAFGQGRDINTEDIITAIEQFKPLSKTRPEIIETMRIWAEQRCVRANTRDLIPGADLSKQKSIDVSQE